MHIYIFLILDLNTSASSLSGTEPNTPHQISSICNTSSESQSSDEGDRTAVQKSTSSQTTPPPPDADEYNFLYYYDPKNLASTSMDSTKKIPDMKTLDTQRPSTSKESAPITPLIKLDEDWETMFARAEGLYGYGHTKEACILGVKLVDQFLQNPPNFIIELPPPIIKGKRKKVYTFDLEIKMIYNLLEHIIYLILNYCFRLIQSVINCLH